MKLMSMTDFVLQENFKTHSRFFPETAIKYAEFLKQPLTLGMFIPVDANGNVLKEASEPNKSDYWSDNDTVFSAELYRNNLDEFKKYQKAKEKVLFGGFEVKGTSITDGTNDVYFMDPDGKYKKHCLMSDTVEYMVYWNLELTHSALKQIGL